jgi:hypothetical protein
VPVIKTEPNKPRMEEVKKEDEKVDIVLKTDDGRKRGSILMPPDVLVNKENNNIADLPEKALEKSMSIERQISVANSISVEREISVAKCVEEEESVAKSISVEEAKSVTHKDDAVLDDHALDDDIKEI